MKPGRITELVALALALTVLLWAIFVPSAGAQSPAEAPLKPLYEVALPLVQAEAFPQAPPAEVGAYRDSAVNVAVWMGPSSVPAYDWLQASSLLTFWEQGDDGTQYLSVCWYGTWANGAGGARCDIYP